MLPAEEIRDRISRCKEALQNARVKLTHQRLEVFREVASTDEHPDAETVYRRVRARIPMISLDTVYRTLSLLQELGMITTLGPPRERVRYDANTAPHHHFICSQCGAVCDFECEAFDHLEIPAAVRHLGDIDRAQVEVRGLCCRCARGNRKNH